MGGDRHRRRRGASRQLLAWRIDLAAYEARRNLLPDVIPIDGPALVWAEPASLDGLLSSAACRHGRRGDGLDGLIGHDVVNLAWRQQRVSRLSGAQW